MKEKKYLLLQNVNSNRKFLSGIHHNQVKEFCGEKWPLNMDGPLNCTCFVCNV